MRSNTLADLMARTIGTENGCAMTPAERAELGRAMGASRLGKKRGPYKKRVVA